MRRFLASPSGVCKVQASSDRSVFLAVVTPAAGKRLFCAKGKGSPTGKLCTPPRLADRAPSSRPRGLPVAALASRDPGARARRGVRPAAARTRSRPARSPPTSSRPPTASTPARPRLVGRGSPGDAQLAEGPSRRVCDLGALLRVFGPKVKPIAMPSATTDTFTAPEETVLDVEALASLAPGLDRITPIYVPLDQSFPLVPLSMFGALDQPRRRPAPQLLSVSDGVFESRFTKDQLKLSDRFSSRRPRWDHHPGRIGRPRFPGLHRPEARSLFPSTSPFATSVGGTDLTLTPGNEFADQIVWSTFATAGPGQGSEPAAAPARSGAARPSSRDRDRPRAPDAQADPARPRRRLDGLVRPCPRDLRRGRLWLGDRRRHQRRTPLTAAIVALVVQQERDAGPAGLARCHRCSTNSPKLGLPLDFRRVTKGHDRPTPSRPRADPAGGAAQPGYDLATGLGSLKAAAFAAAVAPPG